MARVALDAMGGDFAPSETVAGAIAAVRRGYDVVLVGDEDVLKPLLADSDIDVPVVHASQTIGMGDNPAKAIRDMPDSSIVRAARMVRDGEAEGLVSAGSTGAALAAAAIVVGRIPGVIRPAIASVFPTPGTRTIVLDSGANPDCKPENLLQFGIMGSLVAEIYLDLERPRVGLLTIGEERGKGRDLERAAFDLLEAEPSVNFVGNVEGRDLARDVADVYVTDGFTGNVVLKTSEGIVRMMLGMMASGVEGLGEAERTHVQPMLGAIAHQLSDEKAGGAHLVGVRGVVVIGHGSSNRRAVERAVEMAADGAERGLVDRLASRLNA